MRKLTFCLAIAALLALPVHAAVAAPDNTQVRTELSRYFSNIAENSPTVLGGVAKSPDTMQAIQRHIGSMSDEELARFGALMAQSPDWKIAPEALASSFPPEVLDHIRRVGANHAAHVPNGEQMRDDVLFLVAVLKVLPEEKLKELGVDRQLVSSLDQTFHQMTPLQTAMLQQHSSRTAPWGAAGSAAVRTLPPAVQRGAAALAEHGPLTAEDVAGLNSFRAELMDLLDRIELLPEETRATLGAEKLRVQLEQLGQAPPDVMFMVRQNIQPEMLVALDQSVALLERISNLSDRDKKDLEQFRSELTAAFEPIDRGATGEGQTIEEVIAGLPPEHLMLMRDAVTARYPDWQSTFPYVYQALASPALPERLRSLTGENPDPAAMAEVEAFRQQTLAYIVSSAAGGEVETDLATRARQAVQSASATRLEILRATLSGMPQETSAAKRLQAVVNTVDLNCSVTLPVIGLVDLNFICTPIENAVNAVATAVTDAANVIINGIKATLEAAIETFKNAANAAIAAIKNTVDSIVSGITSTADSIWSFVQTVPQLAWDAIQSALNLLLDIEIRNGVTLRMLVASGVESALASMQTLAGLAGDWWTAVSSFTLPMIPCPPAGFHTPFGNVGDDAAADNYERYKLLIDGLIGMIPDTETSLAIKIPAQVLYMAYDFLGECLDQAASESQQAMAASRHDIVTGGIDNLRGFVGTEIAGFTAATVNKSDLVIAKIGVVGSEIQGTMLIESTKIQTAITSAGNANQASLSLEAAGIRALLKDKSDETLADIAGFRQLYLRTFIERALQIGGIGMPIASLQLPEPNGFLGVVRDVVEETIRNMQTASQSIGQAQKFFDNASSMMMAGQEKAAFTEFAKAYQQATR